MLNPQEAALSAPIACELEPCFQHEEAQNRLLGVTADDTRYFHVVAAIDAQTTQRVMSVEKSPCKC